MQNKSDFQTIHEAGFESLLKIFRQRSGKKRDSTIKGIGDDASVIKTDSKPALVQSSILFIEGVHFDLTYTPLHHLGYKCVTAAVSNICAMNSTPGELLLDIAVPNKISVKMIDQFYNGVQSACHDYEVELIGGDTTASQQLFVFAATVNGYGKPAEIVYRKGAQNEDVICVTGDLGGAIAGLRVLMREKKAWEESGEDHFQPDLSEYHEAIQKQLVPRARLDIIRDLSERDIAISSMIDISKGLISDAKKLCESSGIGMEIFSPAVPISLNTRKIADEMQEDVDKYAFYGGEDFELMFTTDKKNAEKIESVLDEVTVIGRVTNPEEGILIKTGTDETIQIETDIQKSNN